MEVNKYRLGIIYPTDFTKSQHFGGSRGLIENILPEIKSHTVIFGIGINGTIPWKPILIKHNISFIPVCNLRYLSVIPNRLQALWAYFKLRKRIMSTKINIFYIHSPECALPFIFLNKDIPVIFHQHGSGNPMLKAKHYYGRSKIFKKIFDKILREIHKRSDWIIVIDKLCYDQAKRNGAGNKTSILMNAVDIKKFCPNFEDRKIMRKKYDLADEQFVILFAGRIEEIKRIDRIIDSMTYLNLKDDSFRLFVVGDGSLKKHFEQYTYKKKLQRLITFVGHVPNHELPSYYNMADVIILCSEMEGVPMVLLEALACGTPVIAPRLGGIPDFVSDSVNGIILDLVSPNAICQAIKEVRSLSFSRIGIAKSVLQLSSTHFFIELERIIEGLLKKNYQ